MCHDASMAYVQFNEPQISRKRIIERHTWSRWLIEHRIVKDEKQSIYFLLAIIGLSLLVSFLFMGKENKKPNTGIDILPQETIGSPQGL